MWVHEIAQKMVSFWLKNLPMNFHNYGITIISGLAEGIDTVSHLYSYNQLGKTIAVLGNGFNHIFPEDNKDLFKKILDNGGLAISEYPPNTKVKSQYFPKRNRIVSGLSLGVLVIESTYRSGTSITAKLALSQNKKVFALPHEIWNSHGVGTNTLLKHGSILVTDTEDILQEFKILKKLIPNLSNIQRINLNSLDLDYEVFESFKKYIKNPDSILPFDKSQKKKLNNPELSYLYDLISDKPISINELCKKTSQSVSKVFYDLFKLELDGYVKKVEGGYVCILNK